VRFTKTPLPGVVLVDLERLEDDRGWFARSWCRRTFAAQGLDADLVQCNVSHNLRRGTLRGMHFQVAPHAEAKLVRVTRGAIHDVVLDLRPDAPTYLQWAGFDLSAENGRAVFVPAGCAHGFVTLEDETDVLYQMSVAYDEASSRGVRFDDPTFGIVWPDVGPLTISAKDRAYPDHEA